MQTTGNLGLKKPEGTDIVDIADLNGNMDILDTAVNGKVDKVTGKQLSTNDYTTAEKTKLAGIATGANNYAHPNHTGDVTSNGDGVTAIAAGVIVDADVNAAAAIAWTKLSKTGASLADLPTRSAADLSSGTLPAARLPAITGDITIAAGTSTAAITAGSIVDADINATAGIDASKIGTGAVSNTEFGYLDGTLTNIQTQLNGKISTGGGTMTGSLSLPNITATGTNGFNHRKTGDSVGILTYRAGATDYQIRVNDNGTGSQTDTTKPTIALQANVDATSPKAALWYRPAGGNADSWINAVEVNPLTAEIITRDINSNYRSVTKATLGNLTYYVRTDGNDNNTGTANTAGGAFKTIAKAVSMFPEIVNHTITINVAAGTYAEIVSVQGKTGAGYINFVGTSASVLAFEVIRCNRVQVTGFTATSTTLSSFTALEGGRVDYVNCVTTVSAPAVWGFSIIGQTAFIKECTISNKSIAIYANLSRVRSENNSGTGNNQGLYTVGPAEIKKLGTQPSASIAESVLEGGFIYGSDSAGGVVNPWGDNTDKSRSVVSAGKSTTQAVPASAWTKVQYPSEFTDNLNEYDRYTSRFTAAKTGIYSISAQISYDSSAAATGGTHLRIFKNGSADFIVAGGNNNQTITMVIGGNITIDMNAGDYIEVYAWTSVGSGITLAADPYYNRLQIVRVA